VLAEEVGRNRFRIVRSPGFVLGLAAADEIELEDRPDPGFRVLRHGGNVSIQFFRRDGLEEAKRLLKEQLEPLGGWFDGEEKSTLVFSVPISVGFPSIENAMREVVHHFPDAEWGFGNVYDPKDGVTPLNWWVGPSA
jgi:hypothetical protein